MANIARKFPEYNPNELFGNNEIKGNSIFSHEALTFNSMHSDSFRKQALLLLEEEKSKCRKGLVKHCLP